MSQQRAAETGKERRLQRAVDYVQDYWFPIQGDLLRNIKQGLESDLFSDDISALVGEIRNDYSLFLYCFKGVVELLNKEGIEVPKGSPVEILHWAGIDYLKQILAQEPENISKHQLNTADSSQKVKLHEMLVSSSSAEVLARQCSVDPDQAFSAALVRQLGCTLVAWNYQETYQEALRVSLQSEESLDLILTRRLGFSPTLLAVRVLMSWGLPHQQIRELGLVDESLEYQYEQDEAMIDSLIELCKVGEALARAHHPEIYPKARDDFEFAHQFIAEKLGPSGMRYIQEKVLENCENYLMHIPHVFDVGLVFESEGNVEEPALEDRNPFISLCSPAVSRQMHDLYRKIDEGYTTQENLRALVRDVVPAAQMSGGCIYTIDPSAMILIPQMDFGDLVLRELKYVDYSLVRSDSDMVAVAFQSVEPVIEYKMSKEGKVYTAIAGMFGQSQRVGVVYIEIPDNVTHNVGDERMVHFQAIRHALNDCLRLT